MRFVEVTEFEHLEPAIINLDYVVNISPVIYKSCVAYDVEFHNGGLMRITTDDFTFLSEVIRSK